MKALFFLFFIATLNHSFGAEDIAMVQSYHQIVSDKPSEEVDEGKCLVKGKVIDLYSGEPIQGVVVAPLNKLSRAVTDSLGNYSVLISATDTSIFAFKSFFDEYVIWNYPFQNKHLVELNFYLAPKEDVQIMKKPVIYLYSEEEIEACVKLDFQGALTFTYPEYKDEWNIKIHLNQLIVDGVDYPYLFWEGDMAGLEMASDEFVIPGAFVAQGECQEYLDNSLSAMGFNSKEKADFITYWMPELTKDSYVLIQFMEEETIENSVGGLSIEPAPSAIKRVYMLFETFSDKPAELRISPQSFQSFERHGFHVLEWGGCQLNTIKSNL